MTQGPDAAGRPAFVRNWKKAVTKVVYDISQEVFSCAVYPGDPAPEGKRLLSVEQGDVCNLTAFSMCAHNGTHVDAPFHFLPAGKQIHELPVETFVGPCAVTEASGDLGAEEAEALLAKAAAWGVSARLLIRGPAVVTAEAARVFAGSGLRLIGVESQSFGPVDAPMEVHLILLGAEIALLEGIRLDRVPEGRYLLSAAPLNLGGCDGAPCRAVLMELP